MKISLPSEPVVYYECSYGDFRLTYYIPPEQLQLIIARNNISPKVLEDFPDGIDLNCTESNFAEFQKGYGYRPPLAPDSIHRAFFALLSSTRDWKNFRGTGFIPVKDIERFVEATEAFLEQNLPMPEQSKQKRDRRARQETMAFSLLEPMALEGIDSNLTLKDQRFSPIDTQAGENSAEFFSRLLRSRGKR